MNSTPAASNARRTAKSLAVVIDVSLSAVRRDELWLRPRQTDVRGPRRSIERELAAALIWALVRAFAILTDSFRMILFIPYGIQRMVWVSKRHFGPWRKI